MSKITYDVSDVDSGSDFDTPIAKGLYTCVVEEIEETVAKSSGDPMLKVTYKILNGEFKNRQLWDYIVLTDAQEWKLSQFVAALGLKAKGTLDTNKAEGTKVQVRTKLEGTEDSEYGIQARVKVVLAMPEEADEEEDEDEDDVTEVEPEEVDSDEEEDDSDEDDDDEDDEDDDEDDEDEDEDEDEEDEDEDEELTLADLKGYDRAQLKAVIKENELGIRVSKKMTEDDIIDKIAEAFEWDAEDDEEDDEEEGGYDDMSLADLKATLKERGLKTTGKKAALISRLEEDDSSDSDDDPF